MRKVCYNSADFRSNLNSFIKSRCKDFEIDFDPSETVEANFRNLLEGLAKKSTNGKYVLLIDEYDAPIAGMLDSDDGRRELVGIRKTLHDFYIQAKAHCGDMRFLMVTGVSKFAKTSIFSALNKTRKAENFKKPLLLAGKLYAIFLPVQWKTEQ